MHPFGADDSDHHIVLMTLKLQLSRLSRPKKDPNSQINYADNFKKSDNIKKYRQKVNELQAQRESEDSTGDQKWSTIVYTCHVAGERVLDFK